ncbi:MAG: NIPSNAP family protein [Actinomycetota bacterium]|nr:NIPSNAP family protein [Actinomycetota bacterium]
MADRSTVLHVTLKIRPGQMGRFNAVMAEVVPAMEERGWRLLGAWSNLIGRLDTVIDLWALEDANAVGSTLTALAGHPESGRWYKALGEVVMEETLQLMLPVPYMH